MIIPIILASGSKTRKRMLQNANVKFETIIPRVDEGMIKSSLIKEGALPRDISDTLAEVKAKKVSTQKNNAFVIGCDQVLAFKGQVLSKPSGSTEAIEQLKKLRGQRHTLFSASVIYSEGKPIWRHIGEAKLSMRDFSDDYLNDYVERNWSSIQHCVGGYQIEAEGARLFHSVEGDYFHILGMPLLEILSFLALRRIIKG